MFVNYTATAIDKEYMIEVKCRTVEEIMQVKTILKHLQKKLWKKEATKDKTEKEEP